MREILVSMSTWELEVSWDSKAPLVGEPFEFDLGKDENGFPVSEIGISWFSLYKIEGLTLVSLKGKLYAAEKTNMPGRPNEYKVNLEVQYFLGDLREGSVKELPEDDPIYKERPRNETIKKGIPLYKGELFIVAIENGESLVGSGFYDVVLEFASSQSCLD